MSGLRPAKTFDEMGVPAHEDSSEKKKTGLAGKVKKAMSIKVGKPGKKADAEVSRHAEQADHQNPNLAYPADLDGPVSPFSLPPHLSPLSSDTETPDLGKKQAWEKCPDTLMISKYNKDWPAGLRCFEAPYYGLGRAGKVKLYGLNGEATYYVMSDDKDLFPGRLTKLSYDVHRQFV